MSEKKSSSSKQKTIHICKFYIKSLKRKCHKPAAKDSQWCWIHTCLMARMGHNEEKQDPMQKSENEQDKEDEPRAFRNLKEDMLIALEEEEEKLNVKRKLKNGKNDKDEKKR